MAELERHDTRVARGAVSIYSYSMATLVFATASLVVWANTLTTTEIGVIAGIQLIIVGFSSLANLSVREALMKFIPEFLTLGEKEKAAKILRLSVMLVALVATSIAIFLIFTSDSVARIVFHGQIATLWIQLAGVDLWLYSLGQVFIGGMWGLNLIPRASMFQIMSLTVRYALSVILVVAGFGVFGIFISYMVGDILLFTIAGLTCFLSLYRSSNHVSNLHSNTSNNSYSLGSDVVSVGNLLGFSLPLLVSTMMIFGLGQIDKIFLLLQLRMSDLGVYNVALGAASLSVFVPNAITIALVPSLSSLTAKKDMVDFKHLSGAYTRYVSLVSIPMSVGMASLSTVVIQIFGGQYLAGAYPAAILSLVAGVTCVSSVLGAQLIAVKRTQAVMLSNLAGLLAFVVILVLLVPLLGIVGAAWGRAAMTVVMTFVLIYVTHKHGFFVLDRKAYSASMFASTVMGVIVYMAVTSVGVYSRQILMLPILVVVGIVVYLSILRLMRVFTPDDVAFMERLLPKRMGGLVRWALKLAGA